MPQIKSLHIYPVKSLGGISLQKAVIGDRGFDLDRRWMLIDKNNRFLSQRELAEMSLLKTKIVNDKVAVWQDTMPNDILIIENNNEDNQLIDVTIWDDICKAIICSQDANKWFSEKLNFSSRLVYMPDESRREVDHQFAKNNEINGFSDDFPITMISEASLDDLNQRMEIPIPMDRFRPNIVIEGCNPFEEDTMGKFSINGIQFKCAKPLARCPIPSIDQKTAKKNKEPLATLSTFRKTNNKIYFGQNLLYSSHGNINVGDELVF